MIEMQRVTSLIVDLASSAMRVAASAAVAVSSSVATSRVITSLT